MTGSIPFTKVSVENCGAVKMDSFEKLMILIISTVRNFKNVLLKFNSSRFSSSGYFVTTSLNYLNQKLQTCLEGFDSKTI